jgi:hypothetical protein
VSISNSAVLPIVPSCGCIRCNKTNHTIPNLSISHAQTPNRYNSFPPAASRFMEPTQPPHTCKIMGGLLYHQILHNLNAHLSQIEYTERLVEPILFLLLQARETWYQHLCLFQIIENLLLTLHTSHIQESRQFFKLTKKKEWAEPILKYYILQ